jgi:nucleoid DNA-binding protein
MKKPEIARQLARQSRISTAAAADELDRVVHRILTNLRKGRDTPVPGLGVFAPGPDGAVLFHPEKGDSDEPR